jgi:hypothetical protein
MSVVRISDREARHPDRNGEIVTGCSGGRDRRAANGKRRGGSYRSEAKFHLALLDQENREWRDILLTTVRRRR